MAECHPPCGGCGLKSSDTADVRFRRKSPSVWRVWIEMNGCFNTFEPKICHPPCGGCGLKLFWFQRCSFFDMSPSVWRVWIEICYHFKVLRSFYGHPPCGGCGLKYLSDVYPDRSLDHSLYGKRG